MKRKIVRIDEEKCDGCGLCEPSCAEGALRIIDGKARLVGDRYCDGLGACLGECPRGAITIEEREAEEFDGKAVDELHTATRGPGTQVTGGRSPGGQASCPGSAAQAGAELPCGCPGTSVRVIERTTGDANRSTGGGSGAPEVSELRQWPVQLALVPPGAPYLKGADILVAADCVPFAFPGFHRRFLKGRAVLVGCPKLDDAEAYVAKLAEIIARAVPRALTVVHMEVPCCFGLSRIVTGAVRRSGVAVPVLDVTVGAEGAIEREEIVNPMAG
ncbi:MAG: 4Fe-4S binding protein [Firmicutes bacterium]|nr:4Fe-4S binding protein [Bacillota bacterium]